MVDLLDPLIEAGYTIRLEKPNVADLRGARARRAGAGAPIGLRRVRADEPDAIPEDGGDFLLGTE